MSIPTLTTGRLCLRPFLMEDAERLHRMLNEPGVLRYFPNPDPPSLQRVQGLVSRQQNHWAEHGFGWWAVECRGEAGIVGWNGLQYLPELDQVEVGYLLGKSQWGCGLATEGALASVQYGFEQLRIESIIALVHPENRASERVTEKLGMRHEDRLSLWGIDLQRYSVDRASFGGGDWIHSITPGLPALE